MAPLYFIKKYADNGENPKILGSFDKKAKLYVLSSEPTAKYSKWNVLGTGKLQEDKKIDPRTPALAIKYPKINTLTPIGSANDIDDIFIENSGTQIRAEDFPLYKALKRMREIGYTNDDIVAEIRKHSKDEDQKKRLLRIFLEEVIEQTLHGGEFENPRRVQHENQDMDRFVGDLANMFPEIGQQEILNLLQIVNEEPGAD